MSTIRGRQVLRQSVFWMTWLLIVAYNISDAEPLQAPDADTIHIEISDLSVPADISISRVPRSWKGQPDYMIEMETRACIESKIAKNSNKKNRYKQGIVFLQPCPAKIPDRTTLRNKLESLYINTMVVECINELDLDQPQIIQRGRTIKSIKTDLSNLVMYLVRSEFARVCPEPGSHGFGRSGMQAQDGSSGCSISRF